MKDSKEVIIGKSNQQGAWELIAMILNKYMLDLILDPKFDENDYHYPKGKSLKQWIEDDLALKLKRYITSMEVKKKLKDEGLFIASPSGCSCQVISYLDIDLNIDGELVNILYFTGLLLQFKHIKGKDVQI